MTVIVKVIGVENCLNGNENRDGDVIIRLIGERLAVIIVVIMVIEELVLDVYFTKILIVGMFWMVVEVDWSILYGEWCGDIVDVVDN